MVSLPGGEFTMGDGPDAHKVKLSPFYIDKYEVSTKDYKEFILARGYLKKEFWKHPFIKDGKEISWNDAMKIFVDRSQLPGPRSWINQEYPEGKGNYPGQSLPAADETYWRGRWPGYGDLCLFL